ILIPDVLECDGWLVFASWADIVGKQQYTFPIFKAAHRQHLRAAIVVCAMDSVGACWECFSRDYKVVGDVHDNLIDFLGPGGGSERSQHKKSGQKSDINRFHNFSFCVVWSVVSGSRLPWGVATHGPRPA